MTISGAITRTLIVCSLVAGLAASNLAWPAWVAGRSSGVRAQEPTSSKVWVNTRSGVYHCPGSRYYGSTRQGTYLSEAAARTKGYRPAYGRACSEAGATPPSSRRPELAMPAPPAGAQVWVNTSSGVYHCPGSRYYGTTRAGKYLSEGAAKAAGHRPAYGRPCS